MRKISFWAKHHRYPAIASIIVIKLILAALAIFIGRTLLGMEVHIPTWVIFIAVFLFILAGSLYPFRKSTTQPKNRLYIRQKICDFVLGFSIFLFFTTSSNNSLILSYSNSALASTTATANKPTAADILASLQYRDKHDLSRQEKRILRKEFKKQLGIYVKQTVSGKKDDAGKTLLIILTIIIAVGLLSLLAALCCSISCGGAEFAAVIVGILGLAAIVAGSVVVIQRISKGPKKKKDDNPNPKPKSDT